MRRLLESLRSFCHYLGQTDRWHRPASGDSSANRSHHMIVWATFMASLDARHSCRTTCHANLRQVCRAVGLDLCFEFVNVWILLADGTSGSQSGAGRRVPGLKQGRSYSCTSRRLMRVKTGPGDAM